jgi:hypothetical protein
MTMLLLPHSIIDKEIVAKKTNTILLAEFVSKILSRVRGSRTNNNGFWIGWLDFLALLLQLQPIITARNQ